MENRIAGSVVLYHPDNNCIENINSYLAQVSLLCVIDNSEEPNTKLIGELILNPKVIYVTNRSNLGIAQALNQAANIAKKYNFDFLLTMDQDSIADKELVENYKGFLSSNNQTNIGILAPVPVYLKETLREKSIGIKEIDAAITSGCLLNLNAYEKVGSFKEELFIDYVDFEYCLRLKGNGYKIFQLSDAIIYHQLGNIEKRHFLFKTVFITHHSPERIYYRTRNRLYIARKFIYTFPSFVIKDFFVFINELFKILFFESNKSLKAKMIILGIRDNLKHNYGKFGRTENVET